MATDVVTSDSDTWAPIKTMSKQELRREVKRNRRLIGRLVLRIERLTTGSLSKSRGFYRS